MILKYWLTFLATLYIFHSVTIAFLVIFDSFTLGLPWHCCHDCCLIYSFH